MNYRRTPKTTKPDGFCITDSENRPLVRLGLFLDFRSANQKAHGLSIAYGEFYTVERASQHENAFGFQLSN
jgi:hypothetical protein